MLSLFSESSPHPWALCHCANAMLQDSIKRTTAQQWEYLLFVKICLFLLESRMVHVEDQNLCFPHGAEWGAGTPKYQSQYLLPPRVYIGRKLVGKQSTQNSNQNTAVRMLHHNTSPGQQVSSGLLVYLSSEPSTSHGWSSECQAVAGPG